MTQDTHEDPELVEDSELEPEELTPEQQITALTEECEELRSKWVRAQADYQNLRRRGQTEYESALQRHTQPLLEDLLLVVDYLDMALAAPAMSDEAKNLAVGVEMTRTKLLQTLERENVTAVSTEGTFDPDIHEATATVDAAEVAPGTIVGTSRRGYMWGKIVLRHAQVTVASDEESKSGDKASPTTEREE